MRHPRSLTNRSIDRSRSGRDRVLTFWHLGQQRIPDLIRNLRLRQAFGVDAVMDVNVQLPGTGLDGEQRVARHHGVRVGQADGDDGDLRLDRHGKYAAFEIDQTALR